MLGFSSMSNKNFQMYKLGFEEMEKQRSNFQHSLGLRESKRIPEKNIYSAFLTTIKLLALWITTSCRKFLKEMGIPDHLLCLLRNLYAGQETIVRTGHGSMNWFKIRQGV